MCLHLVGNFLFYLLCASVYLLLKLFNFSTFERFPIHFPQPTPINSLRQSLLIVCSKPGKVFHLSFSLLYYFLYLAIYLTPTTQRWSFYLSQTQSHLTLSISLSIRLSLCLSLIHGAFSLTVLHIVCISLSLCRSVSSSVSLSHSLTESILLSDCLIIYYIYTTSIHPSLSLSLCRSITSQGTLSPSHSLANRKST